LAHRITSPTIASFSPDSNIIGDGVTDANVLTLDGTAVADSLVSVFDGTTFLGTTTADANGAWAFETGTLADGVNDFTATDSLAGNTSPVSNTLAVVVDTQAPAAPVIASEAITGTNQTALSGTAEANSTITIYDGMTQLGVATVNTSGAWSFTSGILAAGIHTFTATDMDVAGNTSLASSPVNLTMVTQPLSGAAANVTGSGAPEIANWTHSGSAGDTLVLSGQNLGSASQVYVSFEQPGGGSSVERAAVESADGSGAVVVLPKDLPSDAIFTLWATNADGSSNSVLVNAPQLWWAGPNAVTPGGVTSLFGQNLVLGPSDHPTVTLEMTTGPDAGQTYTLGVVDANAYRVDVQIPTNLPVGAYSVLYNSGAVGGASATSQSMAPTLDVSVAPSASSHAMLNIANFGAVAGQDDTAAFNAATSAAYTLVHNGSGVTSVTIQLGAGEYDISSSIGLPNGIDLEGLGAGVTTIKATPAFHLAPTECGGAGMLYANQTIYGTPTQTNITIGNLTIDTNGNSTSTADYSSGADPSEFAAIWARSAYNFTVNGVTILAQNGTPIDAGCAHNFTLENSTIVGETTELGVGNQIFIHGNSFFGTDQAGASIFAFGASDVAIYGNTAQNLDPNPTAQDVLTNTFQGRFYYNQADPLQGGQAVNQYIAQNQTNDIGPNVAFASQIANAVGTMNTGEQILFEAAGTSTEISLANGLLGSATPTSLTLNLSALGSAKVGEVGLLTIVSGTGTTETTQIASYDAATGTYYFDQPLAVLPDATSVLMVSQAPSQVAIVNNTLQGVAADVTSSIATASSGVEVYPGGSNVVIAGNTFSDLPQGVNLWSFSGSDGNFVGASFFQIDNNTFINVNRGVSFVNGHPADENAGVLLSAADTHQVIGTTIENNNLAGINQLALSFTTNDSGSPVDVAAFNVASNNILPSSAASLVGGMGMDGGSPDLLILNNQSTPLPSGLSLAEAISFTTYNFNYTSIPQPFFDGYYQADGSFALNQITAVAGTYAGQAALIATDVGANNWVGFAANIYPWTYQNSPIQVLNAGSGNDILVGSSAGQQVLNGGDGDDILVAATGTASAPFLASAQLIGGAGADLFVFTPGSQFATNEIVDFNTTQGDKIVLDNLVLVGVDPFAAGYLKILSAGSGSTLLYSADGAGTNFVTLGTIDGVSLSPSDIVVTQSTQVPAAPVVVSFSTDSGTVGDGITNNNTLTLNGTAVANSTVQVFDGAIQIGTAVANASGAWSFATATLMDGVHSFISRDMDAAGNISAPSSVLSVTVDSLAPAAPVIVGDVITSTDQVILSGTAEANSTVTVFEGATQLGMAAVNASGAWSFTTTPLAVGSHTFTANATDAAGNISLPSLYLDPTILLSAPKILSFSPDSNIIGDGITNANHITLSGSADANITVNIFDGTTLLGTASADGTGAWSFATGQLADGVHNCTATEMDKAGDVSVVSNVFSVVVDTQAPAMTTSLANDTGSLSTDKITSNSALMGTGGPNAAVTLKEGATVLGTTMTDADGHWTFAPVGLLDGTHTIVASETDAAGNIGAASFAFALDTHAPAPTITNETLSHGKVTLSGTTAEANDTLSVYDGSTLLGITKTDSNGLWSFVTGNVSNAVHNYTVNAADLAGNIGHSSNEAILGSSKADTLAGTSGNDIIIGNGGNDKFTGGGGADVLTAGSGSDSFIFKAISDSTPQSHDTIINFNHPYDTIVFSNVAGINATNGVPTFQGLLAGSGSLSLNAHSIGYMQVGGNTEVLVNTTNSTEVVSTSDVHAANMEIILAGIHLGLTQSDFHLI
jgi:hypothetical protein